MGYSFYVMKGQCLLTVYHKSKMKLKLKLKELINRSNGLDYDTRKQNSRIT